MRPRRITSIGLISLLAVILATPAAAATRHADERPVDFGKQWVRKHPYTLMGLAIRSQPPLDARRYIDAHFSTLLVWKTRDAILGPGSKAGLTWHAHLYAKDGPTEKFQKRVAKLTQQYPGNIALMINDEPLLAKMPVTGQALAWLRRAYPDTLSYCNALPMGDHNAAYSSSLRTDYSYEKYVDDYIDIIRPDVMMFDIYPYQDRDGVANVYFLNMQVVREASLKAGIPYWVFVQSWQGPNRRLPSESDLRMQLFSTLTFGYTGIAYFGFDTTHERAVLDVNGVPTRLYEPTVRANQEVMNIAGPLRYLTSTEVRFIKRTHGSAVPQGLLAWDNFTTRDPHLKEIEIKADSHLPPNTGSSTAPDPQVSGRRTIVPGVSPDFYVDAPYADGLIGNFVDDSGQRYFLVCNLWHSKDATAAERQLAFTLKFDPTIKTLQRLSRLTGKVEKLDVDPQEGLQIILPGGTGDLFKYDTGPFVGLD